MQCSRCPHDAIVFQPYSGLHLCSQHFVADVEAKAKKMIRAQGWLRPGDSIAVLLSGDPSSNALLYFLQHLTAQRRDIRITAISIAYGTGNHSDISHAKRIADNLNTEFLVASLPEESEKKNTKSLNGKNQDIPYLPSARTSRSILLDRFAHRHGITKIAWGLCLDDVSGMVLESILRGEAEKLVRRFSRQDTLIRVCPFLSVTSAEISLYASICGFDKERTLNPEPGDCLHKDMVTMLDTYTSNHPATKYALLNLGEKMAGFPAGIAGLIRACEENGEYQRDICNDGSTKE